MRLWSGRSEYLPAPDSVSMRNCSNPVRIMAQIDEYCFSPLYPRLITLSYQFHTDLVPHIILYVCLLLSHVCTRSYLCLMIGCQERIVLRKKCVLTFTWLIRPRSFHRQYSVYVLLIISFTLLSVFDVFFTFSFNNFTSLFLRSLCYISIIIHTVVKHPFIYNLKINLCPSF